MTAKPNSAARPLRIIKALRGHSYIGATNGELANRLGESPANIHRALQVLIDEGFATKLDNGRFALSISLLQIATAHADETDRMQRRLAEINQRIRAGSQ